MTDQSGAPAGTANTAAKMDIRQDLAAASITSFLLITYSLSSAALIFTGGLAPSLPYGIGCSLVSAAISTMMAALLSTFYFTVAGLMAARAAILAVMAGGVVAAMGQTAGRGAVEANVFLTLILSTVLIGVFLFALGWLRLGRMIRYIPQPVVGGFMGAIGWLLLRGSAGVLTGVEPSIQNIGRLFEGGAAVRLAAGVVFGLAMIAVMRRYRHYLVLPGLLLVSVALFHLALLASGGAIPGARRAGWMFEGLTAVPVWLPWDVEMWTQVDWSVMASQTWSLVALAGLTAISILLNATAFEIETKGEADFDKELRGYGLANMATGLFGGFVVATSPGCTYLNLRSGAASRLSGVFIALIIAFVLAGGAALIGYIPRLTPGALIFYIGASMLFERLWQAYHGMSRFEGALMIAILVVIANWGFLAGTAVGVVAACVIFAISYSRLGVIKHSLSGAERRSNLMRSPGQTRALAGRGEAIRILSLQGFLFFGTATSVLEEVKRLLAEPGGQMRFLIIDFCRVNGIDSSAALNFVKMKQYTARHGVTLLLAATGPDIEYELAESGFLTASQAGISAGQPGETLFPDLDRALEHCENAILGDAARETGEVAPFEQWLGAELKSSETAATLIGYFDRVRVAEGEKLFSEGDQPDTLYFLDSGRLSVVIDVGNGKTKRLRSMTGRTVVGEMGLYLDAKRSASVVADSDSQALRLTREALAEMSARDPAAASALHGFIVRMLAERLAHANREIAALLR